MRIAGWRRTEALFREINERVEDIAVELGDQEGGYEYFCECANKDCTFRLVMSVEEYESVRSDAKQFVFCPITSLPR